MSAFVCGDSTFKLIALYVTSKPGLDLRAATEVAQILYAENVASVLFRYRDLKRDEYPATLDPVEFADQSRLAQYLRDPIAIIKIAQCLRYQSCEHPEWENSQANRIVDTAITKAISKLPGYDAAPWGL